MIAWRTFARNASDAVGWKVAEKAAAGRPRRQPRSGTFNHAKALEPRTAALPDICP
jgi:hypothetical protein